jgi:hypothetical protein
MLSLWTLSGRGTSSAKARRASIAKMTTKNGPIFPIAVHDII